MKNKKTNEKIIKRVWSIASIVLICLVLFIFLLGIIFELAAPTSGFAIWTKENIWDVTTLPQAWNEHKKNVIHCVLLIVIILGITKLLRLLFRKLMQKSNKARTMFTLLDGMVKYGSAIALIFLILQACGVNTTAIWESVGILTLIIGLGAQSLIADIIAGIFIIFENEYTVGEIISIDDFRGTVSEIGIRSTKLLDMAGNIKIVNNSDIKNVVNLSRELSLAIVDCEFPYDVPLEFVEKLLKDNLENFKTRIPEIVEGPFYKGVSGYGASNVAVKLIAKCSEEDRYQVQRDLLREYRVLFVANGIDLSYDQIVVNQPEKSKITASEQIKKEADTFVEEQKTASENLEEQVRE